MTSLVSNDLAPRLALWSEEAQKPLRKSSVRGAFSEKTLVLADKLSALRNPAAPSVQLNGRSAAANASLEERLFDARAAAKQMIASIAMHIDAPRRARLFKQLDSMHALDDWDEGDDPLDADSFASFLRSLFHLSPTKYPSLGLTHDGHLLAAWTKGDDQLVIEFMPKRKARWSLSRSIDGQVERAAGDNAISRLHAVLSPYEPDRWLHE